MRGITHTGVWEQFGIRDGLRDMKVECVFVDSTNTVWVGTRAKGVARYRGDEFEVHSVHGAREGGGVFGLVESIDGDVWLA